MPPGSPDAADAARCRPPSDRLRVYSEERCHLTWREKALIVAIHGSPLPISVSEHVFSVAKTSVYFLVFPKNEPLVSLVSFGPAGRAGTRAQRRGFAGRSRRLYTGSGRMCPRGAAVVAQCTAHDYRMCKALFSARVIIGSSPTAGRAPLISFAAIPVSGVADDAGRYGTRESVPTGRRISRLAQRVASDGGRAPQPPHAPPRSARHVPPDASPGHGWERRRSQGRPGGPGPPPR